MKEIGIYVHIPFCKKKCVYCDFVSYENKQEQIESYIKWLLVEIEDVATGIKLDRKDIIIKTIYIGGGTPSFIHENYIEKILQCILKNYCVKKDAEITIEVNPGSVTKEKLKSYKKNGINRLSIGMQSTNDSILRQLGRIHHFQDFLTTYQLARQVGFDNINIDLMIGLENQNIKEELENIINLQAEHLSVYSLIVEEHTPLYSMVRSKKYKLPEEKIERDMYWNVKNKLEKNGYQHYEISNFAKKGLEAKHNLDCWHQKEYIGFGVAAHSYTDKCRYSNITSIEKYIENFEKGKPEDNIVIHEIQNKTSMAKEYIMLNLRTIQGCNLEEFKTKFGYEIEKGFVQELERLKKNCLIAIENGYIHLTNKGIDLANLVWEEFV